MQHKCSLIGDYATFKICLSLLLFVIICYHLLLFFFLCYICYKKKKIYINIFIYIKLCKFDYKFGKLHFFFFFLPRQRLTDFITFMEFSKRVALFIFSKSWRGKRRLWLSLGRQSAMAVRGVSLLTHKTAASLSLA